MHGGIWTNLLFLAGGGGGVVTAATGNTANAQLAARQTAQAVSASLLQPQLQLRLDPIFSGREETVQRVQNAQGCGLLGNGQSLHI